MSVSFSQIECSTQGTSLETGVAARLRASDKSVIDELRRDHEHRLRRFLRRLTSDTDLAEDLIQDTWVRVIVAGSSFRGESRFGTWLCSVAKNLFRDKHRKKTPPLESIDSTGGDGGGLPSEVASGEESPLQWLLRMDASHSLSNAVRELNPDQQEIVTLRYMHEMSMQEISERLQIPLSTAKSRLRRALQALRSLMGAEPSTASFEKS